MNIKYKTIIANTLVDAGECYLMGVELANTSATSLVIYEGISTGGVKVATLRVTDKRMDTKRMFPFPGIKCSGIYAAWTAGIGTVYYHN